MPDGPVSYDADKCIGCRYCIWACPWGVPAAEWDSLAPKIQKCTHCADRAEPAGSPDAQRPGAHRRGHQRDYEKTMVVPACVKACPADALTFGDRDDMLDGSPPPHRRPPGQVRGPRLRREGGGRHQVLYLSSVPFEKLGFPDVGTKAFPAYTRLRPACRAAGGDRPGDRAGQHVRRAQAPGLPGRPGGGAAAGDDSHAEHPEFERHPAPAADPLQLGPDRADGVRGALAGRAVRAGAGRQHPPVRYVRLGAVDRLRPGLDRGGRRRLRDRGPDLCLPAQGSVFAWAGPPCSWAS